MKVHIATAKKSLKRIIRKKSKIMIKNNLNKTFGNGQLVKRTGKAKV